SSARDDAFATVAMLSAVVAAVLGTLYWVARTGFDNPPGPVMKAVALAVFIATAPLTVRTLLRLNGRPYEWMTSYSFLSVASLAVTALLGWITPLAGLNPFYLLAIGGAAGVGLAARGLFRSHGGIRGAILLAAAGLFAQWSAGVTWGRIYKNPLFLENLQSTGVVHHDSIHLVAFGAMLRTYGTASTGIDGLVYIPYHWGTPWIFAQFSNLLDTTLLDFYQLGYVVIFAPFFFAGHVALATEIIYSRASAPAVAASRRKWFWAVFLAATIGVIPIQARDALGVYTSNLTISESYAVAVPMALLLAGTVVIFWRGFASRLNSSAPLTRHDTVFLLAVVPLWLVSLGVTKLSLMILGFLLGIYFAVRLRLYARPAGLVAIAVAAVLVLVSYKMFAQPTHQGGVAPLDFLRENIPRAWWPFFPLLHLFWSWLYVALRLVQERVGTTGDFAAAFRERRLLDVEAVFLVALAGVLPGLVIHIDGGAAFYFSDVQRWLSLSLLLAMTPFALRRPVGKAPGSRSRVRLSGISMAVAAASIFAVPFVITLTRNAFHWTVIAARGNSATRAAIYPDAEAGRLPTGIHGLPHLANSTMIRNGLAAERNYPIVSQLRGLSNLALAERRRTALFIPQTETRYWELLTRPGACAFSSLVAPALAEVAMIDGMPPVGCRLSPYYGFGVYTPRDRPQTEDDSSAPRLCAKAGASGLDRVMILRFDEGGRMNTREIECDAAKG
nr:hypothetical protein [Gemmatimonadota bacterium]